MAKINWGLKRTCQSCGARFYDLGREQIACPKCNAEFDPEAILKTKRTKASAAPRPAPVVKAPVPEEAVDDLETVDDEAADEADEKEDEVIEDTSELGEDTEDVAEVVDKVEEEER